jgi:NIF3 (NGG1p interacting factor 3).
MKVYDAYKLAIETGIKNDPRPKGEVELALKDAKENYDKLSDEEKQYYDMERLWNPYSDSRLLWGEELAKETEAERFMWGIDAGTGEVMLADRLKEKGQKVSALVAHHPVGMSKTPFPEVMWMQTDMFHDVGIPINVTEALIKGRMDEVSRNVLGSNYNQSVDAAKLLNILMFNVHSPADNMVQAHLEGLFEKQQPKYLEDVIKVLMTEPEFRQASKYNDPPKIIVGGKKNRCGKIISKMTGGTSGPKEMYEKLAQAGIGTVVGMHFPENHIEEAKKYSINMIVSGHMASDSLGINKICDVWEKKGIETIGCSGFMRFSRN